MMLQLGMLHRRALFLFAAIICAALTLLCTYPYPIDREPHAFPAWNAAGSVHSNKALLDNNGSGVNHSVEAQRWLNNYNFTFPLNYTFREILTQKTAGLRRGTLTKIDEPLLVSHQMIGKVQDIGGNSAPPLRLDVPYYEKGSVDASHLIFGIQTTIRRLNDSVPQLARWLSSTGAKLCVVLKENETVSVDLDQMSELETRMRSQGFEVSLFAAKPEDSFPQRYFSLVSIMYQHRTPSTKWVSLIDDDTFFPSMPALLTMLAARDSSEQHYLGGLSEDWWAVSTYGFMAFGGGGVFLSVPLAKVVDANTETCKNNLRTSAGDISVMDCIYAHTSTKLTPVPDLHQVDIHGDLAGFYESGRNHLSLHHWKDGSIFGKGLPMAAMHLVSDICGECFLQRFQFGTDMVLTNGYSLALYPKGHVQSGHINEVDMTRLEETWSQNMDVKHSLGPTRPRLELEQEKIVYSFSDSYAVDGGVRQVYLHKGLDGEVDTVVELLWRAENP